MAAGRLPAYRPGVAAVPAGAGSRASTCPGMPTRNGSPPEEYLAESFPGPSGGATTQQDTSAPTTAYSAPAAKTSILSEGGRTTSTSGGTVFSAFATPDPSPNSAAVTASATGWSISLLPPAAACHGKDIVGEYWNDARLVTASGTVAVYDVASLARNNPPTITRHEWPNVVEKSREVMDAARPGRELGQPDHGRRGDKLGQESDRRDRRAWIGHRLEPEIREEYAASVSISGRTNPPTR